MLEKKYKDKVEAMQVYVPLLTKLITKLETKNDKSEENLEKISQLKILLQQLLDPQPGISFEELNDCHQVMENLFKINKTESTVAKLKTDPEKDPEKIIENQIELESNKSEGTVSADESENVEIIEFSEDEEEDNESFEEEMILPDDEEVFLNQNIKPNNNEQNYNEEVKNDENNENENDKEIIEHINKTILSTTNIIKSKEVIEPLSNLNEKEHVTKIKQISITNNQTAVELQKTVNPIAVDNLNNRKQCTLKRVNDQKDANCEMMPQVKNVKSQTITSDDKSIENEHNNEDNDDDIEIIETRSSPILIESDDDVEMDKNTKQAEKATKIVQDLQQPLQQIMITNVTSLSNKKVILKNNPTQMTANNTINNKQTKSSFNSGGLSTISNIKLQRKQILGPNPQLFCTKVGDRKLFIPNAFYGNVKTAGDNPDAAHCRWLDNFLRHFCSPYNIAHNTCFLLLQRALRTEDFLRIKAERAAMTIEKVGEIDQQLLRSLHTIFYLNCDPKSQKLTFVGRKFCNLAFVNILDKTISLTVDSRTNAVTSRTRISAATLETLQNDKITTSTELTKNIATSSTVSNSTAEESLHENLNSFKPVRRFIQIQQKPPIQKTIIQTSDVEANLKGIPATIIHMKKPTESCESNKVVDENSLAVDVIIDEDDAAVAPQCSLPENTYESFTTDDDVELLTGVNNDCGQVDLSAAISKDITSPKISNTKKKSISEKPTKSFEMAFLERLAAHDKEDIRTQKDLTQNELIVLDDDEDDDVDEEPKPGKLPLEPRLVKEKQIKQRLYNNNRIKNIDVSVHALSRYKDICILCNHKALHVVGHYVHKHPEYEVYVSRPTPKFALLLLNNEFPLASHDRERNNLNLFISTCVFCEKKASFTLSYWYQHFASHTGEFAYKCSACGVRKPTRALLLSHLEHCHQKGSLDVIIHYDYGTKKITAYMCRKCHFTQMRFASILKHFKTEHNISSVEKRDWLSVTLFDMPKVSDNIQPDKEETSQNEINSLNMNQEKKTPIIIRDSNGDIFEIAEIDDGKTVAVDLTANSETRVINEAESGTSNSPKWYNTPMNENGDVEGIVQAYINEKN